MSASAINAQEVLSTINYNPSRMGNYDYLKVSDAATLRGGLNVEDTLSVGSNGPITINSASGKDYSIKSVEGKVADVAIEMPNTEFNIANGVINGGTIVFGGADVQSTINNITNAANSLMYANTTKADSLNIKGPESVDNVELNASNNEKDKDTTGFFLSGYDIPNPTKDHVSNDGTHMGVEVTGTCNLTWVERQTNEATPKKVYVLALDNCSGTGGRMPPSPGEDGSCTIWATRPTTTSFDNVGVPAVPVSRMNRALTSTDCKNGYGTDKYGNHFTITRACPDAEGKTCGQTLDNSSTFVSYYVWNNVSVSTKKYQNEDWYYCTYTCASCDKFCAKTN